MTADEQTTGPVWRDRGTIIANQQARIAELEAACQRLQDDYQGALAERDDARAEVERWKDKANEAGAAYANANTKHHAELDRANRLERLADTLAGRAVDLEDKARAAEADAAGLRARMLRLADDLWRRRKDAVDGQDWYAAMAVAKHDLLALAAEPTPAADDYPWAVRLADCTNYLEDEDRACTGTLRFRCGDREAACDSCGGRCGWLVAAYRPFERRSTPAAEPHAEGGA